MVSRLALMWTLLMIMCATLILKAQPALTVMLALEWAFFLICWAKVSLATLSFWILTSPLLQIIFHFLPYLHTLSPSLQKFVRQGSVLCHELMQPKFLPYSCGNKSAVADTDMIKLVKQLKKKQPLNYVNRLLLHMLIDICASFVIPVVGDDFVSLVKSTLKRCQGADPPAAHGISTVRKRISTKVEDFRVLDAFSHWTTIRAPLDAELCQKTAASVLSSLAYSNMSVIKSQIEMLCKMHPEACDGPGLPLNEFVPEEIVEVVAKHMPPRGCFTFDDYNGCSFPTLAFLVHILAKVKHFQYSYVSDLSAERFADVLAVLLSPSTVSSFVEVTMGRLEEMGGCTIQTELSRLGIQECHSIQALRFEFMDINQLSKFEFLYSFVSKLRSLKTFHLDIKGDLTEPRGLIQVLCRILETARGRLTEFHLHIGGKTSAQEFTKLLEKCITVPLEDLFVQLPGCYDATCLLTNYVAKRIEFTTSLKRFNGIQPHFREFVSTKMLELEDKIYHYLRLNYHCRGRLHEHTCQVQDLTQILDGVVDLGIIYGLLREIPHLWFNREIATETA